MIVLIFFINSLIHFVFSFINLSDGTTQSNIVTSMQLKCFIYYIDKSLVVNSTCKYNSLLEM